MTQKIAINVRQLLLYPKPRQIRGQIPLSLSFCIKEVPITRSTGCIGLQHRLHWVRARFKARHSPHEAGGDLYVEDGDLDALPKSSVLICFPAHTHRAEGKDCASATTGSGWHFLQISNLDAQYRANLKRLIVWGWGGLGGRNRMW